MESSLIGKALDFGSREYGFESHVSNSITKINSLAHFVNHFKIATNQKSLYFDVHLTTRSLQLLVLFYNLNLVRRYLKLSNSNYRVYPTYTFYRNRTRKIKIYLKSNHYLTIPIKLLKTVNLTRPYSHLILETNKGILTHKQALNFKVSGRLILIIN